MANYDITLKDTVGRSPTGSDATSTATTEVVVADAYQQEGPMTTFFRLDAHRTVIDCWSTRVASFRTTDIVAVRLHDDEHHHRRAGRMLADCDLAS